MAQQLVKYADGETHKSVLESEGLKFLLSGGGEGTQVPLNQLEVEREGKISCLFFSAKWCHPCRTFTPKLLRLYNSVERGKLDIIFVSLDRDEATFREHMKLIMPPAASWLVVPFHDEATRRRLCTRYRVRRIPSLVPLGSDGRTVMEDAVRLVEEYGVDAIPFGANRRRELEAIDAANRDEGNLQQLLCSTGLGGKFNNNYVISRDGRQINVADHLVGKTVGLYFGARWCPPCRNFTTMLVELYDELKSRHSSSSSCGFEIVFVSTDRDEEEFASSLAEMPWLAVPYRKEDLTRRQLSRIYDVKSIPALILLGPDGKTLCRDGRGMISSYGAKAFPFTESRAAEVEAELIKQGQGLPCQVSNLSRHEHLLKLDTAKAYVCDACGQQGRYWVFSCKTCNFDLHPSCT